MNSLASGIPTLNTVYFPDKDVLDTIYSGFDETNSWFGKWSEPVKVANALFGRAVFDDCNEQWFGAGRLFIALCIYRATLEQNRGEPFPTECVDGKTLWPVSATIYLGFARRCFNSGLSWPTGVRISLQEWKTCQSDLGFCISRAKKMEVEAFKHYEEKKSEEFNGEAFDVSAVTESAISDAFAMMQERYTS